MQAPADVLDLSAVNISRHTRITEDSENSTVLDVFSKNKVDIHFPDIALAKVDTCLLENI